MSKEKDLLAEIEHQEAVIAEATERLKALRVDVYALRREALRNKKPTPAMLDVLAKLAAGDGIYRYGWRGRRSYNYANTGDRVSASAVDGLRERECLQWQTVEAAVKSNYFASLPYLHFDDVPEGQRASDFWHAVREWRDE